MEKCAMKSGNFCSEPHAERKLSAKEHHLSFMPPRHSSPQKPSNSLRIAQMHEASRKPTKDFGVWRLLILLRLRK
jgi:hypothetical protein